MSTGSSGSENGSPSSSAGAVSGDELFRAIPQAGDVQFQEARTTGNLNDARGDVASLNLRSLGTGNTLALGIMLASMGLVSEQTPYPLLLAMLAVLGAINSLQFTAMNTVTLIDLDDAQASSGNSLLSVVVQLAMGLGVASAAALLSGFSRELGDNGRVLARLSLAVNG